MTIKFICTCGKHLKARDEMASRRSICPRCGSPVGIPSLKPTHSGTSAAPMTPLERMRHARERAPLHAPVAEPVLPQPAPPRKVDNRLVRLLSSRGQRHPALTGRHLEKTWTQCLLYPLRAFRLCLGLALLLTVLSVAIAMFVPRLLAEPPSDPLALNMLRFMGILLGILIVGLPCSFLECVLSSATAGEIFYIVWSGNPLTVVLKSGVKWITCFLAGPIFFAAFGWLYWVQSGESVVDWFILTELGVVTVAYWITALLSLTDYGRTRDLNPVMVIDMAHRLGWRSLLVILAAALLLIAHAGALLASIAKAHTDTLIGLLLILAVWLSAIFWSTFFCRLFGVWCFRTRVIVIEE